MNFKETNFSSLVKKFFIGYLSGFANVVSLNIKNELKIDLKIKLRFGVEKPLYTYFVKSERPPCYFLENLGI